ncbi:hypothetical protein [Phyllobacterium ifriqiyense]|uniref:hypothetical protein n=1 Tax=Phyllobacterium ifriqiyense TaxID=314238 RepID=UPI0033930227
MTYFTLTAGEVLKIVAPFGLAVTPWLEITISEQIEVSARRIVGLLGEPDADEIAIFRRDYGNELTSVAADPARSLGKAPRSDGAIEARRQLDLIGGVRGVDPETRLGAEAIGNLALQLLSEKPNRIDTHLRMVEEVVFEDICRTIHLIAPTALEALPSNETFDGSSTPIIAFAMTFIQMTNDRLLELMPRRSESVQKRLTALLNKSDRRLLDGIRKERQFRRKNGWLFDGEVRATIFR